MYRRTSVKDPYKVHLSVASHCRILRCQPADKSNADFVYLGSHVGRIGRRVHFALALIS